MVEHFSYLANILSPQKTDMQHRTEDAHGIFAKLIKRVLNNKAESAVKYAKRLIRKNKAVHRDQFLSLLDSRNTPTQRVGSSPSQGLLNHCACTLLPTRSTLLKPRTVNLESSDKILLEHKQKIQVKY